MQSLANIKLFMNHFFVGGVLKLVYYNVTNSFDKLLEIGE